jgi:hypothetical protein
MLRLKGFGFKHYGAEWPEVEQDVEWQFQESTKTNGHPVRIEFVHSALTVTASLDLLQWIDEMKEHYTATVELSHTQDTDLPPNSLSTDYDVYLDRVIFWIATNPEWSSHAQVYQDMLQELGTGAMPDQQYIREQYIKKEQFPEYAQWFDCVRKAAKR